MYELGAEAGKYYSVNVPLKEGIDDEAYDLVSSCSFLCFGECTIHTYLSHMYSTNYSLWLRLCVSIAR